MCDHTRVISLLNEKLFKAGAMLVFLTYLPALISCYILGIHEYLDE
jgi:hypothetical protein